MAALIANIVGLYLFMLWHGTIGVTCSDATLNCFLMIDTAWATIIVVLYVRVVDKAIKG